jgi:hypothetical protein
MEKYKYDVAISFAEEDKEIAEEISNSLKEVGLKPYFYKNEEAENWGENLFNVIIKRYREEAHLALILISKHYVKKRWADIERQIIQTIPLRGSGAYLLPLAIDDTRVDGITDNILTVKWKGNPKKIAEMIKEKLKKISKQNTQKPEMEKRHDINIKAGTIGSVTSIGEMNGDLYQNKKY